jgi:hypothetical protein
MGCAAGHDCGGGEADPEHAQPLPPAQKHWVLP